MSMSIKCCVFVASACISSNSWSHRDLVSNSCTLSLLLRLFHVYFRLCLPVVAFWVLTSSIKLIPCCIKLTSLAIPPRSSILRICCKTLIIRSFRSCSDLHTATIHYCPISKWLALYSAALELASVCLRAIINCTNDRSSKDVFLAIASDMFAVFCTVCFTFSSATSYCHFSTFIEWHLSVLINDVLCYVLTHSKNNLQSGDAVEEHWLVSTPS